MCVRRELQLKTFLNESVHQSSLQAVRGRCILAAGARKWAICRRRALAALLGHLLLGHLLLNLGCDIIKYCLEVQQGQLDARQDCDREATCSGLGKPGTRLGSDTSSRV